MAKTTFKASELPLRFNIPCGNDWEDDRRRFSELPPALGMRRVARTFDVPTEIVIRRPGVYVPVQARYWEVDLYLYCGVYVPRDLMERRPLYANDGTHPRAWVVEVWSTHGDDGHVEPHMTHYLLVPHDFADVSRKRSEVAFHGGDDLFEQVREIDFERSIRDRE